MNAMVTCLVCSTHAIRTGPTSTCGYCTAPLADAPQAQPKGAATTPGPWAAVGAAVAQMKWTVEAGAGLGVLSLVALVLSSRALAQSLGWGGLATVAGIASLAWAAWAALGAWFAVQVWRLRAAPDARVSRLATVMVACGVASAFGPTTFGFKLGATVATTVVFAALLRELADQNGESSTLAILTAVCLGLPSVLQAAISTLSVLALVLLPFTLISWLVAGVVGLVGAGLFVVLAGRLAKALSA